jgi:hypothetical protein
MRATQFIRQLYGKNHEMYFSEMRLSAIYLCNNL